MFNKRKRRKPQDQSREQKENNLQKQREDHPADPSGDQDVPVTGNDYSLGDRVDEVDMSDLVDLSDAEDMEAMADEVDPLSVRDSEDSALSEMAKYTNDPDILGDLGSRNTLPTGTDDLLSELKEHTSESPNLSAEDIDADWWADQESGEESVGGSVATPEQNIVDEIGEATGVEYNDFEPLETEEKLDERDKNRWELNAASVDDDETQVNYNKNKFQNEGRENADYSKVDKDFSELMNNEGEEEVGSNVDEFGDSIENDENDENE